MLIELWLRKTTINRRSEREKREREREREREKEREGWTPSSKKKLFCVMLETEETRHV